MRVIAVLSMKGGAGKTAVATGLAVEIGGVLLDLDPQASACHWRDRREAAAPAVSDVAPARLAYALEVAAAQHVTHAVLDTPPRSETAALEAARAAQLVLVPCRPQLVDLETLAQTQNLLALAGAPAAAVVLTAVPPRGDRAEQARRGAEALGLRVAPVTLGHRAAWGDAGALGLAVTEHQPRGRAAAELRRLAHWVRQVLQQPDLLEAG